MSVYVPLTCRGISFQADVNAASASDTQLPKFVPLGAFATLDFLLRCRVRALRRGLRSARQRYFPPPSRTGEATGVTFDRRGYLRYMRRIEPALLKWAASHATSTPKPALISFVAGADRESIETLRSTVQSLQGQCDGNWVLLLATESDLVLPGGWLRDPRIRRVDVGHAAGGSPDLNAAVDAASSVYVSVLTPGDQLHPAAVSAVSYRLRTRPQLELLYTDEDQVNASGVRAHPVLKSGWNPELLLEGDYVGAIAILRRDRLISCGGWRSSYGDAAPFELLLRYTKHLEAANIEHVPLVLCHRNSGLSNPKPSLENLRKALEAHYLCESGFSVVPSLQPGRVRVKWPLPDPAPKVSILIPTRDGMPHLRSCIQSVLAQTDYASFEIVLVDNQSVEKATLDYFAELQTEPGIQRLRHDEAFNFSAIINRAARHATGSVLVLLNDDTEVVSSHWLDEMVRLACRQDVGAVGAKLDYPDGRIQHAGLGLGIGGVAGHLHLGADGSADGYLGRLKRTQAMGAVTGACLAVEKRKFDAVGGMDEDQLRVALNDVDLCLKLAERGWRSVWTPHAELKHHESYTRGRDDTPAKRLQFRREHAFMRLRWGATLDADPYYHPHLSRAALDLRFHCRPTLSCLDPAMPILHDRAPII